MKEKPPLSPHGISNEFNIVALILKTETIQKEKSPLTERARLRAPTPPSTFSKKEETKEATAKQTGSFCCPTLWSEHSQSSAMLALSHSMHSFDKTTQTTED